MIFLLMSGSLQSDPTFFWMRVQPQWHLPCHQFRTWQMVGLGHNPWWLSYHVWLADFLRQTSGCCELWYCLLFFLNNRVISQERSTKKFPGRFSPPLRPPDFMDEVLCPENVPFQTGAAPNSQRCCHSRSAVVEGWTCGQKTVALRTACFGVRDFQGATSRKPILKAFSSHRGLACGDGLLPSFRETFGIHTEMWVIPYVSFLVGVSRVLMIQQFILWLDLQWLEPLPLSSCAASNLLSLISGFIEPCWKSNASERSWKALHVSRWGITNFSLCARKVFFISDAFKFLISFLVPKIWTPPKNLPTRCHGATEKGMYEVSLTREMVMCIRGQKKGGTLPWFCYGWYGDLIWSYY